MDNVFTDRLQDKQYKLFETPISSGGEGAVYEIYGMSDRVAKLYHQNRLSDTRRRKLEAMTAIPASQLPECSWPIEMLYQDGEFRGYIMDKVTGVGNLVDFFVYENRSEHTWKQYVVAAANIAAAVHNIHDSGIVIGDLKPDNIIIDPVSGLVKLVDTDSYQIRDSSGVLYPCTVATPEYIPPELQNINFEKESNREYFTFKTDDFSLAVIIFKVLMNGVHPFACFSATKSLNSLESNIRDGNSPYFRETNSGGNVRLTLRSPEMSMLPDNIRQLFHRAFVKGRNAPDLRPSAEEWFYALSSLDQQLCTCRGNGKHIYYDKLGVCPWCDLERQMAVRKLEFREMLNKKQEKERYRPPKPKPPERITPRPPQPVNPPVHPNKTVSGNTGNDDDYNNKKAVAIALLIVVIVMVAALVVGMNWDNIVDGYSYYSGHNDGNVYDEDDDDSYYIYNNHPDYDDFYYDDDYQYEDYDDHKENYADAPQIRP